MTALLRAASGTFVLKVAYAGLSFAAMVVLARILGTTGYGVYAFATAWVALLGLFAIIGFDRLLVREIARLPSQAGWRPVRGLLRRSNQIVALASITLAAVAAVIGGATLGDEFRSTFWIAMLLVPVLSLSLLRQAAMQGLNRVVLGFVPETLVRPALLLVLVAVAYLAIGDALDAPEAMALTVVAACVAFGLGAHLLRRSLPAEMHGVPPEYRTRDWLRSAAPLTVLGAMGLIDTHTGTVMLGAVEGPDSAAVYAVASRSAEFIALVLLAVNAPLAPAISRLYSSNDMTRLQETVTRTARTTLALTLPVAAVFMVFPTLILQLFGSGFTGGGDALVILAAGHLFNATMGSVGILLVMTGHERDAVVGVGLATVMNVALTAALVPVWGIEGAALARGVSLVVWNVVLAVFTYRRLKIHSTAFGKLQLG